MEARLLMLASNNIFSPANGQPLVTPSQDIVLGCYYLTKERPKLGIYPGVFVSADEVIAAYQDKEIPLHIKIKLKLKDRIIETTPGRVLFNQLLPEGIPYVNEIMDKSKISHVISECYRRFGLHQTILLLDKLKTAGFEQATLAGISISIEDIRIPAHKEEVLKRARQEVQEVEEQYRNGLITDGERYNKIIDIWTKATEKIANLIFQMLDPFNPIYMMADSGARGSQQQIRQLAGMRGLMAKPSGEIIESPITANFREGLTVLEYFISTHGARKGLADTALKTADSGYLTRRLIDVAQDVIVNEVDCGTLNGILIGAIIEGDEIVVPLKERIIGRVALDNIVDVVSDKVIVEAGEEITEEKAGEIEQAGIEKIRIRSVLTCEAKRGICAKCYGRNLAAGRLVELGEAVGIVAAQSIGEPGTQLTMRTFHIGGTASRVVEQSFIKTKNNGMMKYVNMKTMPTNSGQDFLVLSRNGQVVIGDESGREFERYTVPQGSILTAQDQEPVEKDRIIVRWNPYISPIISELSGWVKYEDIVEDKTVKKELDVTTGFYDRVIIDHKGEYHPQIVVLNEQKEVLAIYSIPVGAHIVVKDGQNIAAGTLLAKTPRQISKTTDITGGLPRVAELFEARRPKDPAVISEIDGIAEFDTGRKGQRKIIITSSTGMKKEYIVPPGKHLNVYKGDIVTTGQKLVDGPIVPQDILRVLGDKKLQEYLVNEIQEVYRLQGVKINDKHIEVIVRQMLRKVKIEESGDTEFLVGMQVDRIKFQEENEKVMKKEKKPAKGKPILLGITKASLSMESFIAAASFQETTRVLTDAAAAGRSDALLGLKENVIMGHLIPAGTGFSAHRKIEMCKEVPTPVKVAADEKNEEVQSAAEESTTKE